MTLSGATTTTSAFLFIPSLSSHQFHPSKPLPFLFTSCCWSSPAQPKKFRLHLVPRSSPSSSSSAPLIEQAEQGSVAPPSVDSISSQSDIDPLSPPRGCKACGSEQIEPGCNGEGRIQGGIATVPGFGWWPIKAYRPCPGFLASGGRYRRVGQSMDEVASGRGKKEASSMGTNDDFPNGKKGKQGLTRFKR